ncbi:hypothetical protein [Achromobacter xylosoxidans]|uniref:hypothetical protein n=1 Tax=Alcaligenes xylosoxydans xylosoxydans TaxID=85698 RepID=UPI0022B8DA3A|nr:hypothetical protein [Achromobacter xylosoxidans]MCZ8436850.1 hypothetical protein [Achromobacter xylosoxidans]
MTTKHTPGPWRALPEECDKPYIRIRGTRLGGRYKVANVLTPVYDGVNQREAEETRDNARLISAAPDMLAALEIADKFCGSLTHDECPDSVHIPIRAAIAKARGAQ